MCTLTLAWDVFPEAPVLVAANRDESIDRPSEPPGQLEPGVVGPRDAQAGGTWIGYNEDGVFVGITNRWVEGLPAGRSRGLLVRDCLREPSADEAASLVEESCATHDYDGFNLVLADGDTALLLEWGGTLRVTELGEGVHVVGNVGFDGTYYEPPGRVEIAEQQARNARRLADHLGPFPDETPEEWLERAGDALGNHQFGVCVHEDGYGTRSSSLVLLGADGSRRYDFADGPPCRTPYETVIETQAAGGDEGQS
ncbi:NRDE family protein [Halorarum halophilum]|uniref:NRDE family protein n=1 Tax=Halorarum halophilum TaxID=2743090 RepID=A0A7D5GIU1_9EURY|nr:NRDE family protein [Halobaculum halophilum]QLG26407.1 NRDE family protein [Halobaculum halophilum]